MLCLIQGTEFALEDFHHFVLQPGVRGKCIASRKLALRSTFCSLILIIFGELFAWLPPFFLIPLSGAAALTIFNNTKLDPA